MDTAALTLLEGDLAAQVDEIERIYRKVHARAEAPREREEIRESLAFQLHNLYCAFEDLFTVVAAAFENRVSNGPGWHVELLSRMRRDLPGIRPRLVDELEFSALNELRAFRHVFRHAYALELSVEKLSLVVDKAIFLEPRTRAMIRRFVRACGGAETT